MGIQKRRRLEEVDAKLKQDLHEVKLRDGREVWFTPEAALDAVIDACDGTPNELVEELRAGGEGEIPGLLRAIGDVDSKLEALEGDG